MKQLFFSFLLLLVLSSCGSSSPNLKPIKESPVEGGLKDYIEIVDQDYAIDFEERSGAFKPFINIKVKLKKNVETKIQSVNSGGGVEVIISLYDKDNNPLSYKFGISSNDKDEFGTWLNSGEGERTIKLLFGNGDCKGSSDFFSKNKDISKAKFFRATTKL